MKYIYGYGSVVKLKSGGPRMTITGSVHGGMWTCSWFHKGTMQSYNLLDKAIIYPRPARFKMWTWRVYLAIKTKLKGKAHARTDE